MEPTTRIRVALADDHPFFVAGAKFVIHSFPNCEVVVEAHDGESLLMKLRSCTTSPDICLLDIRMPKLDGYQTLIEIKKQWPSVAVIIQSELLDKYNITRSFKLGASAFLPKNANPEEVLHTINEVYENGVYYSKWVNKKLGDRFDQKDDLTDEEIQLLKHCCEGLTHKQVAQRMNKSIRTIDDWYSDLNRKVDAHGPVGLVIYALSTGIYTAH